MLEHASDSIILMPLLWLFVKHFICDFPLQSFPWILLNKGTYGHLGGIVHAIFHGIGTFIVLMCFFDIRLAASLALIDSLIHYHIDWAKVTISKKYDLTATNSEWFWFLFGFDQLLHHLTYIALIYYLIS